MKRIAFEWKTRVVDFSTYKEAEDYLKEMDKKYNVCKSTDTIYQNNKGGWSLKVEFTGKNAKINGRW